MQDRAAERRAKMTTRVFHTMTEADQADLEYWRQIPADERVRLVWTLSLEQWRLSGQRDESGLCRSVARVYRG